MEVGSQKLGRLLWAVFLLVVAVVLGTEHNGFPWYYHNDEPSKVRQVMEGWRNMRHPPLMVEVVSAVCHLTGRAGEAQEVVMVGRVLSAFYVAGGVALLADAAWLLGGPVAGMAAGVLLLAFGPSYEAAHYFKEDALLLLGLGMACHAQVCVMRGGGRGAGLWWVLACAVLMSGKWVGWLWAVAGWLFIWRKLGEDRLLRLWCLVGLVGLVAVLIGWRVAVEWRIWLSSSEEEVRLLWSGDYRSGMEVPHRRYVDLLGWQTGWNLAVFVWMGALATGFWRRCPVMVWTAVCAAVTLVGLSWMGKYSERYLMPISWWVIWWAVVVPCVLLAGERLRWMGWGVALVLMGWLWNQHAEDFSARRKGFAHDSRAALQKWLEEQCTADWKLARESLSGVTLPGGRWQEEAFFAADLGTVDELIQRGITHVLISYDVHHRFVDGSTAPQHRDVEFHRRERFYRDLLQRGKVVWESPAQNPKPLHPGLRLIGLRDGAMEMAQHR